MRLFNLMISVVLIATIIPKTGYAKEGVNVSASVDVISRYMWRGLMINDAPNVQPAITVQAGMLEMGLWGSSTLSKTNQAEDNYAFSHELDFWMGLSHTFGSGLGISALLTDFYFPNAGIGVSEFNNYDDEDGPGGHTIEAGVSLSGPDALPLSLSAYINIFNDAGNNTYVELDYSTSLSAADFDCFLGVTGGSKKNQAYYGSEDFAVINLGFTVSRELAVSESFSLPIFVTYILNPNADNNYLLVGFSL